MNVKFQKLHAAVLLLCFMACSPAVVAQPPEESPTPELPQAEVFQQPKLSLNYSPYVNGLSPEKNSPVPLSLMEGHLKTLRPYADTIRLFGVSGELAKIYKPAKETYGFRVISGCWLDRNYPEREIYKELDALIKLANDGYADIAVVGSETLFRRDFSKDKLIEYIEYVRGKVNDKNIPVTTSDTATAWNSPELVNACDVILVTIYPFFSDVSAENAAEALKETYEQVKGVANGKQVIISETGWPTAGSPEGAAVPSEENARLYFEEVYEWSRAEDIEVIFFGAIDEAWKREGIKGDIGMHWGHFNADGTLKEVYAEIYGEIGSP